MAARARRAAPDDRPRSELAPARPAPQYHTSPVTSLRFAPRSMLLATAARDGTLALWPLYQPEGAEDEGAQ